VDRRSVAAQQRLPHAVEVDDHGDDLVALLRAARDRFADQLVGKLRRQFLRVDQTLGIQRHRRCAERDSECNRLQCGNA